MHKCNNYTTVDREFFAVKIFLPVGWVAKIKNAKISYMHVYFLPLGHAVKIKCANISYAKIYRSTVYKFTAHSCRQSVYHSIL